MTLCKDSLPDRPVWLVIKRTVGPEPSYFYYISNAPASTPLSTFVWLSGVRWAIEPCFEEGKTELGLAHYEVRKYPGWHHHMLTSMLAHFFLWHLKGHVGKKSPGAHGVAVTDIIGSGFAPANVHDGRGLGVSRLGAKAQSPSVSIASKTAASGSINAVTWVCYPIELFSVVQNKFCIQNSATLSTIGAPTRSQQLIHPSGSFAAFLLPVSVSPE